MDRAFKSVFHLPANAVSVVCDCNDNLRYLISRNHFYYELESMNGEEDSYRRAHEMKPSDLYDQLFTIYERPAQSFDARRVDAQHCAPAAYGFGGLP